MIEDGAYQLIRVRPLRRHREFVLPLAKVALSVIWRVVQAEAAERAKTKRRKRRLVKRY